MPFWPRSFHVFRANLQTVATEWKLSRRTRSPADQHRAFTQRVAQLHRASWWKSLGLKPGLDYDRFRRTLPLSTDADLAPAITRMVAGESNLLAAEDCPLFIQSSGATTGEPNLRPLPAAMRAHFQHAWRDALLYHAIRARHAGVFSGRHLYCGGSSRRQRISPAESPEAFATSLTGAIQSCLPRWMQAHREEPGRAISELESWEDRLAATARQVVHRDISLVVATPDNLPALASAVANASGGKLPLGQLWPNWECWIHHGTNPAPRSFRTRAELRPPTRAHEVYAAPEGIFAVQDNDRDQGLRLLTDAGIFFEFLPLGTFDPLRVNRLGSQAIPLQEVQVNVDYALIVTTPAGLVRHLVGDSVRFTSVCPPRLVVTGRLAHRLDLYGEDVSERDLAAALLEVCHQRQWTLTDFHVAPLQSRPPSRASGGQHEWWVELQAGSHANPTGPVLATELDRALGQICATYAAARRSGNVNAPVVRLVMPGVFAHWKHHRGMLGGENKPPHCRKDRRFADELAALAQFAAD